MSDNLKGYGIMGLVMLTGALLVTAGYLELPRKAIALVWPYVTAFFEWQAI